MLVTAALIYLPVLWTLPIHQKVIWWCQSRKSRWRSCEGSFIFDAFAFRLKCAPSLTPSVPIQPVDEPAALPQPHIKRLQPLKYSRLSPSGAATEFWCVFCYLESQHLDHLEGTRSGKATEKLFRPPGAQKYISKKLHSGLTHFFPSRIGRLSL